MTLDLEYRSPLEKRIGAAYFAVLHELDQHMTERILIDSWKAHREKGVAFPFPSPNSMRPPWKIPKDEKKGELFTASLVVFTEGYVTPELKRYIETKARTELTRKNLEGVVVDVPLDDLTIEDRVVGSTKFPTVFGSLLPQEAALIIQRDPKAKKRFVLTDGLVKLEFPIKEATSALAKWLGYVSKSIDELDQRMDWKSGEVPPSEKMEEMFYQYWGFHAATAGGRRKAAATTAQLLRDEDSVATVYVSSQEEGTLTKLRGGHVTKMTLLRVKKDHANALEARHGISMGDFAIDEFRGGPVVVTSVSYATKQAAQQTGNGGKRNKGKRPFNPRIRTWRTVDKQLILPNIEHPERRPIEYRWVSNPHNPLGTKK